MENENLFFIIGLRASGTSVIRQMIVRCPEVAKVEFEPHDLMFASSTRHLNRYGHCPYHRSVIRRFKGSEGLYGAKIALNTGIEALNWRFLDRIFDYPKFIFITRNAADNFWSLRNKDKNTVKGILPMDLFKSLRKIIIQSFVDFHEENRKRSCIVDYDKFVLDPDKELEKVSKLLGVFIPTGVKELVHKPKYWSLDE